MIRVRSAAALPIALLVASALLLCPPSAAVSDEADVQAAPPSQLHDWKLVSRSDVPGDGYALYARPHPGSQYPEYRLEALVDGDREEVISALEYNILDKATYPDGFRRTLLRRESSALVTYDYIEVPFLSDRDVVIRIDIARGARVGEPAVRWRAIEDEGPRSPEGVVRMPAMQGSWTLAPRGARTLAVYQSHTDFGGSVPRALVEARLPSEIKQQAALLRRTLARR